MTKIAVITGTIGNELLRETVISVQRQKNVKVEHWIVVDGAEHERAVTRLLEKMPVCENPLYAQHRLVLPQNTGGNGYLCHRINGALPWLVNTDYVTFLDEDNEFEPDHLENLLAALAETKGGARWAFSFRKIIDRDGTVLCNDTCESLGSVCHSALAMDDRHIDTNCYLLERELAVQICPLWNARARVQGQMEADRQVCRTLLSLEPVHGVSRHHSVRYRVDGRSDSVSAQFFDQGNAALLRGVGGFDAIKKDLYLFHFDPQRTAEYCHGDPTPNPLKEWCPGMWHGLLGEFNLLDGYANIQFLPLNATCLVTMCFPETLPLELFKKRKDLHVILYTAEGPNIRHQAQWDLDFLKKHFSVVLTYWKPLLDDPTLKTVECPHNARFLTFPQDDRLLRFNSGNARGSVMMCLENRTVTDDTYEINGIRLQCLDPLREKYVRGLRHAHVAGNGWEGVEGVTILRSGPRDLDPKTPIDYYEDHDFALIIENCNAEGYVSEKFGDALMAGVIPIYYGVPSATMPLPDVYIDLRKFEDGEALQRYLDTLDIEHMKERVRAHRIEYLAQRGTEVVADAVKNALLLGSTG